MSDIRKLIVAVGLVAVAMLASVAAVFVSDSDGEITTQTYVKHTFTGSDTGYITDSSGNKIVQIDNFHSDGTKMSYSTEAWKADSSYSSYYLVARYWWDGNNQTSSGSYLNVGMSMSYFTLDTWGKIFNNRMTFDADKYIAIDFRVCTNSTWENQVSGTSTFHIEFKTYGVTQYVYTTSVSYDANNGSGAPSTTKTDKVTSFDAPTGTDSITISDTIPTKEGYDFLGWSNTISGNPTIQPGSVQQIDKGEDITVYAQWKEKIVTLQLKAEESDTVPFYTGTAKWGQQAAFPTDTPKKDRYTFIGWSETPGSKTSEYAGQGGVVLKKDVTTLYAVWDKDSVLYSLIFDADGGEDAPKNLSVREKTEKHVFTITEGYPTKAGYGCIGWSDVQGGTRKYVAGDTIELGWKSPSLTLYPVWAEKITYTLSFSAEGASNVPKSVSNESITGYADVTIPSDEPRLSGYTFLGWAEEGSEEAKFLPNMTVTIRDANTVYHAVWKKVPVTFTIKFYANGGEGDVPTISPLTSTETERTVTIPDTQPTKAGYAFIGWAEMSGSKTADYQPGDTIVLKDTAPAMELYAVWKALDVFTLKFDANTGGNAPANVTGYSATSECTVTIPADVPTKADHRFVGWSETSDGSATIGRGSEYTMKAKEVTLYAIWDYSTENTFALKFDVDDGTGAPIAQPVTVVAPQCIMTIPTDTPSKEGYVFVGWSHRAGAESADYTAGGSITLTDPETTLYAVWKAIVTYTLTFDPNGGQDVPGSVSDSSADGSVELTVPTKVPTKDGSKFLGWSESKLAVQPEIQPGQKLTVAESKILYAIWNDVVTFTLKFDANGGEGAPESQSGESDLGYFDFDIPSETPTLSGHVFKGWALDPGSSKAGSQPGTSFRATVRDTTLYAVWVPLPSVQFEVKGQTSVLAGGDVSLTVSTNPASTVTASGATWLTYADGKVTGKAPSTPGDYQIVLKAVADGYSETSYAITLNVLAPEDSVMVSLKANGGEISDPYRFVLNGGKLAEPEDPERDGYTFVGWYTQSGEKYDFNTTVTGDLVLVAAWAEEGEQSNPAWLAVAAICGIAAAVLVMRRIV